MFIPAILTWVIQTHKSAWTTYVGGRISALGYIAAQARQRQIWSLCFTSLLSAYNVIDLEGKVGIPLMNEAILTNAIGSFDNQPT